MFSFVCRFQFIKHFFRSNIDFIFDFIIGIISGKVQFAKCFIKFVSVILFYKSSFTFDFIYTTKSRKRRRSKIAATPYLQLCDVLLCTKLCATGCLSAHGTYRSKFRINFTYIFILFSLITNTNINFITSFICSIYNIPQFIP